MDSNISSFISFSLAIISFKNYCCNFNFNLSYLVGSVAGPLAGSVAASGVGSRFGVLLNFLSWK